MTLSVVILGAPAPPAPALVFCALGFGVGAAGEAALCAGSGWGAGAVSTASGALLGGASAGGAGAGGSSTGGALVASAAAGPHLFPRGHAELARRDGETEADSDAVQPGDDSHNAGCQLD